MPRKAIGDKPMSGAERQARQREKTKMLIRTDEHKVVVLRVVLAKISDITSERMKTKAHLEQAIDNIGVLAADALAKLT